VRLLFAAPCAGLLLAGCANPLADYNPPSLVESDQTSMAIEAFLLATEDLAQMSSFGTVVFERDASGRMQKVFKSVVPAIPPDREKVPYTRVANTTAVKASDLPKGLTPTIYEAGVASYIQTGSDTAQLLCTQFMLGLYDKSRYFQFIRTELNQGVNLTNAIFLLANANSTLKDTVANVFPIVNSGLDAYQAFRYQIVNDETIRGLVLQAMQVKRDYYLGNPATSVAAHLPTTFGGAVNAINEIEFLCTRQGIAFLLNHGVAATSVTTDPKGAIVFNQQPAAQAK
jgi:hypothetical protein